MSTRALRTCLLCKYFYVTQAERHPEGVDLSMGCAIGKWGFNKYEDYVDIFREKMESAVTCNRFIRCKKGTI